MATIFDFMVQMHESFMNFNDSNYVIVKEVGL